jgi:hypothetical protein
MLRESGEPLFEIKDLGFGDLDFTETERTDPQGLNLFHRIAVSTQFPDDYTGRVSHLGKGEVTGAVFARSVGAAPCIPA